jgi:hypothetical protein
LRPREKKEINFGFGGKTDERQLTSVDETHSDVELVNVELSSIVDIG